jgi:simple sugar transport system ATP-binding protein
MKVELRNIHKSFGPIRANDGVTLSIEPGTLHGLLGENGAGKSTLMKILSGSLSPDRGEILLDGEAVRFDSPAESVALGVGMLHQDPLDFPALRVIDNFLLGSPESWLLDRHRSRSQLVGLASQFDFRLDPDAFVSDLSIGERQQLEIIRLLGLGVKILILDEPTTAISSQQKEKLFETLRRLTEQGKTVIFVSHKLEEVRSLCSKVSVMARGRITGEATLPCPTEELVQMMFGQTVMVGKRCVVSVGEPILQLENVTASDWRLEVKNLSLEVRSGEVIGLAGLEGSGQHLALRVCSGLLRPSAGRIRIAGQDMTGRSYRHFLEAGVAYMPAGRLEEGLIAGMTLTEHAALIDRNPQFLVDWAFAKRTAAQCIEAYNIKGQPDTFVEELSGGNQQRALLALLPSHPMLLLMEHPTRGLDLESTESIWRLLLNRAEQGAAILFISSDLDELLDRSDRILIFFEGKVQTVETCKTNLLQLGESIGGRGFE